MEKFRPWKNVSISSKTLTMTKKKRKKKLPLGMPPVAMAVGIGAAGVVGSKMGAMGSPLVTASSTAGSYVGVGTSLYMGKKMLNYTKRKKKKK